MISVSRDFTSMKPEYYLAINLEQNAWHFEGGISNAFSREKTVCVLIKYISVGLINTFQWVMFGTFW